jgi:uncharacterized membrane protein YsdA (DUF1294 family)/cold shock CspA family protein
MRLQGRITQWNDQRGFGFVLTHGQSEPLFFHISQLPKGQRRPAVGQIVTYRTEHDPSGRTVAAALSYPSLPSRRSARPARAGRSQSRSSWRVVFALLFAGVLLMGCWRGRWDGLLSAGYALLSGLTFLSYWRDKRAARDGRWRTPENTLHALALFGGWPGALLAQGWLRHKAVKTSFLAVFWVTVLINLGLLGWLDAQGVLAPR